MRTLWEKGFGGFRVKGMIIKYSISNHSLFIYIKPMSYCQYINTIRKGITRFQAKTYYKHTAYVRNTSFEVITEYPH